jgi:hypothetical protein
VLVLLIEDYVEGRPPRSRGAHGRGAAVRDAALGLGRLSAMIGSQPSCGSATSTSAGHRRRAARGDSRPARCGPRTVAYLEIGGYGANIEYYVASAADEVRVAPGGFSGVVGLAGEYLFLGQMWRKFGIEFDVARAGRYKSAVETLTGDEMSDAYREVANSLLDSINRQFLAGIAEGRKLPPESVQPLIDRAPMTPEQLVESGLADGVAFLDEIVASLGGEAVEARTGVDPASLGSNRRAVRLVCGAGLSWSATAA